MAGIDLKKTYRDHYNARRTPSVVDVPSRPFLMIDGHGDPNTSAAYRDAVQAMYPIAYGLRAAIKEVTGDAYTVMPLESLWWMPDGGEIDPSAKSSWSWTAMICLPDAITQTSPIEVIEEVTASKQLKAGGQVRVERFEEGAAAHILHIGSYGTEAPAIAELHDFIEARGHVPSGKHHEIYLSSPQRTDPSKMRTIIRQPFAAD